MKLEIYMKSGNVIKINGVVDYEIKNNGDDIVSLKLEQRYWARRLLIKTISLNQIEAVVCI